MNITECRLKAIREDAANSAEFDLVARNGRARMRWLDADLGILEMTEKNGRRIEPPKSFLVSVFEGDDGFTVENFTVPKAAPSLLNCQHGKPVKVVVESASRQCWDDGPRFYTRNGEESESDESDRYLKIEGCEICKLVEAEEG